MTAEVAVVTGANGQIGQAACARLAARGYQVVGLDVAGSPVGPHPYVRCDLTQNDQIAEALQAVEREHGLVTALINNAGVWHGKSFFEIGEADYDLTFDVNMRGMFFATQHVTRRMIDAGSGGVVVNVASVVGHLGSGVTDYGASKAAVMGFTKSVAKPLGRHGIRVNAVSPGTVNTAMGAAVPAELREKVIASTGLQRPAEADEIASVIAFLAGEESSYLCGAILDVNGGMY